MIEVRAVKSRADLKRFIEFPYRLYRGDRYFVPALLTSEWEQFDRKKNPFFEHAEADLYLALDGNTVVGRVAAIEDRSYNEFHEERAALFGHFEATSLDVTRILLARVEEWARGRGLDVVRGPSKVSSNDMAGMLVENFDDPPSVMMPYNKREYLDYLTGCGYTKAQDTFAWKMAVSDGLPDRVGRIAKRVEKSLNVKIRRFNFKDLPGELAIVRGIYNRAWDRNWGFVPWTDHEIKHMGDELKLVADREVSMIAEVSGEPVGVSIMIPDINLLLRGTGGRLFPLGLPKLLLGKPKRGRLAVLGIVPEFRARGLDAVLYAESFWRGQKKYTSGEFGWTLESNQNITDGMKALGAQPYKRYRVLERRLTVKP